MRPASMEVIQTGLTSHYHAIIFGIDIKDLELYEGKPLQVHKTKKHKFSDGSVRTSVIYRSKLIQEAWSIYDQEFDKYDPIGFVSVGEVTWETCAYVARYVQKKVFGGKTYLQDLYECQPEFSLMSRRPGLAGFFPLDHPDVFDYNILHVGDCPKDIPVPSKFIDLLVSGDHYTSEDVSRYLHLKAIRKEFANDRNLIRLMDSDLGYIEALEKEENAKLQKSSSLVRDLEC